MQPPYALWKLKRIVKLLSRIIDDNCSFASNFAQFKVKVHWHLLHHINWSICSYSSPQINNSLKNCEIEIILGISDGMTINWSSHLNCDVFAPHHPAFFYGRYAATQVWAAGGREGGGKEVGAKKFPEEARSAAEWPPNWAKNNCVICDTPSPEPHQGQAGNGIPIISFSCVFNFCNASWTQCNWRTTQVIWWTTGVW